MDLMDKLKFKMKDKKSLTFFLLWKTKYAIMVSTAMHRK